MEPIFEVKVKDESSRARRGCLRTRHGFIQTPIFMPVGTQATVKSVTPSQLKDIDAQIILGNTYHLNLRPGPDLVAEMGGLHEFMNWDRPILTDSGGFQVFSLAKFRKINDEGIRFKSHIDGREIYLTPESCMDIQMKLGSDIAMVLDECPPYGADYKSVRMAVDRSLRWAKQCKTICSDSGFLDKGHHLFGIVQGLNFADMRKECALALSEMDFPGYAIGGVSVGEPEPEMLEAIDASTPYLPENKPRYAMGLGTPPQLLKMIALGIDMFDCVMPTREARHGSAFTPYGKLNIKNSRFKKDPKPLVGNLNNYTSEFSRSYLRHLFVTQEILSCTLLSIHNLHFLLDLMRQAREHIEIGDFSTWSKAWIECYESGSIE